MDYAFVWRLELTRLPSDPKMVLCAYYKAGHCDKGNKCKFSHDLNVGRKVEKKDLYSDTREEKLEGQAYSVIVDVLRLTIDLWL